MKTTLMFFAVLVLVISCKKKEPANPDPSTTTGGTTTGGTTGSTTGAPVDTCKKVNPAFVGTYADGSDTIKISFLNDNCPTLSSSNTYSVSGITEVINKLLKSGYPPFGAVKNGTIVATEPKKQATGFNAGNDNFIITLVTVGNGGIILSCTYMTGIANFAKQ